MEQRECDLSIVIVSWNVRDVLRACLASIARASEPVPGSGEGDGTGAPGASGTADDLRLFGPPDAIYTLETVVVDNASSDGTQEMVAAEFPWVRLVRSAENLGFSRGNNAGVQAARGRALFFLNPDTEIIAPDGKDSDRDGSGRTDGGDSLWALYAALQDDLTVGMAGPQLRYGDGERQENRRRFPTPLTGFFESTWLGQAWPHNRWAQREHMADWAADFPHDVDWLVGAAMLCRRRALDAVSSHWPDAPPSAPFDEGFFMYSEELDLCRRLKDAGWRIVYVPGALVVHHEGKSSEQAVAARHIRFNRSKVRYWGKWFGPRWAGALRRYLLLEYWVQVQLERAKWLFGSQREIRKQRIGQYKQVLESRLR